MKHIQTTILAGKDGTPYVGAPYMPKAGGEAIVQEATAGFRRLFLAQFTPYCSNGCQQEYQNMQRIMPYSRARNDRMGRRVRNTNRHVEMTP